jgi:aminotransferase
MIIENMIAKKVKSMPPSGIRKFFDVAAQMGDVISLGVGEPDFDTPWHIREEGIYALEKGKTTYTANAGLLELRQEICHYMKRRFHLSYDPQKQSLVTVGGSEAIDLCFRAILEQGDEVLVPEPSFVAYKPCVTLAGGEPIAVPTRAEDEFKLVPDILEKYITDKTKAIVIPYPNNPTGAVMDREDLQKIADLLIKKDILVISDEIYAELTYGGEHVSIANLPHMYERTVVLSGFSKTYAMTGWRLGYAVGPEELISQMTKIHQYAIMCAPIMSQYAAIEALKNGDKDIAKMREAYNERRRVMIHGFREMGLSCFEPKGAFYVFPSIQKTGMTSIQFAEKLLQAQKVAVVPGDAFGACGEGFIRCSYAYSIEEIEEALNRISVFVAEHL